MRDGSDTVLVKGEVDPNHLELPAVQELVRELQAKIRVASESSEFGIALSQFRMRFRRVTKSASPTKNNQTADAGPSKLDPPKFAEFLLTALATAGAAEAMVGDLNECFTDECEKLGRRRAVWRYWARTLRSTWSLLWRAVGKAVKWGAVIGGFF
jgi:hypothetical protein